jgi:hypothetical protein
VKLRIEGDSLRLRLTRKEVASLRDDGVVECAIRFSPARELRYSVAGLSAAAEVSVNYENNSIRVVLPLAIASAWAAGDDVTIEWRDPGGVRILVERDFQCLHKPGGRDPDAYPNPLAPVTQAS